MTALDRKALRDLKRLWPQALAIALVMACGVATLILAVGAYRSLESTRAAYYERYRFADVFANAVRVPDSLEQQLRELPGASVVQTRIASNLLLDLEGVREPASGLVLSLPEHGEPALNRLHVRTGRLPSVGRGYEVAITEAFAGGTGFAVGSHFGAIINGHRITLVVTGIVLSPEFVYSMGPGDFVPDNRRYGVFWMPERVLASLTDLEGAFNQVNVRTMPGYDQRQLIDDIDRALERYGGTGAYGRSEQQSNAFLDAELQQLQAMARIIPPIFLLVAAFLLNLTMSRLVALEREIIGLLKAVGYSSAQIVWHYLKLALAIVAVGVAIGFAIGTWLGQELTVLYSRFFSFPFLLFAHDADIYLLSAGVSALAGVGGSLNAILSALRLSPAVAMSPPGPPRYRRLLVERLGLLRPFSKISVMGVRHMLRWPLRAGLTLLGIAMSVSLLVTALFSFDSIDLLMETVFFRTDRQDATIVLSQEGSPRVLQAIDRLPGVLRSEATRQLPVRLSHGPRSKRMAISGRTADTDLSRILDRRSRPVRLPESGLAISERVAKLLDLRIGDRVDVEFMEGRHRRAAVPVTAIVQSYFGLVALMDLESLNRLAGDGPRVNAVRVALDGNRLDDLYREVKRTPAIGALALQGLVRQKFSDTIKENIVIMTTTYVALSVIVAFGIVYNIARIQFSVHAHELATLRVLGFGHGEVARVLAVEIAALILLAQPLGWLLGYFFAWLMTHAYTSDLYSIPLIVRPRSFAWASVAVVGASLFSAVLVGRRILGLDMIRVLKARE